MQPSFRLSHKKNLLLAFDAFGTLFTPKASIAAQYGEIARRHGILTPKDEELQASFKAAFKSESKANPNYGSRSALGATKWWANVINKTFKPYLRENQTVTEALISDLLTRFSTKDGYKIYPDVLPFFETLRSIRKQAQASQDWKWNKTIVGVVTNSDERASGVLDSLGLTVGPRRVRSPSERIAEARIDHDISFVVLSYDVGYEKPDRRIFDAAHNMLRETLAEHGGRTEASPQEEEDFELLYVGDSLENDCFGAERAGWHAVLLDRDGQYKQQFKDGSSIARVAVDAEHGTNSARHISVIESLSGLKDWEPQPTV